MFRRSLSVAVGLATIIGGQALATSPTAGATPPDRTLPRLSTLAQDVPGSSSKPATLSRPSVRTAPGRPIARPADIAKTATPAAAARGYLKRYGGKFHLSDPDRQTRVGRVTKTERGHVVRTQQLALGLPVIGGELVVATDAANNLLSITGETATSAPRSATPVVSAAAAAKNALDRVARAEKVPAGSLHASAPELSVYDASLVGPGSSVARLVWRIEVGNGFDVRHYTLVDAQRGAVVLDFSMIAEAKELHVCDKLNVRSVSDACDGAGDRSLVGGVFSGSPGAVDVDAAFDNSSDFHDFLLAETGRDSLNGFGMALRSTVRYCDTTSACPYANAYWNGSQMVYGAGYAVADDVVGHELTHGVTEFTSGLFYYYQSGAINESISDVFGELFDQQVDRAGTDADATKWLLGEDLPVAAGDLPGSQVVRDMADPEAFDQPDSMTSLLYEADEAFTDNGGVHTNSGVGNKAAFLMSDGGVDGDGVPYTGIGPDKTLAVWDGATRLLTSGSDYADLAVALGQACNTLVGIPTHPVIDIITVEDCAQVATASEAVQMSVDPPAAPTTPAPVCPAGATKSTLWQDGFEAGATTLWTFANWLDLSDPSTAGWFSTESYASKGKRALVADDTAAMQWSSAFPWNAMTSAPRRISVPTNGQQTYLRFDHAYDLEPGYDGAVVEYSTDGLNTAPLDAGPLIDSSSHPYNGSIATEYDSPIPGQQAFTAWSNGYTSTRVNLTSLAGKAVTPIFTRATDTGGPSGYGWFIDNVEVYTCTLGRTSTSISASATTLTAGGTATISGRVLTSPPSTGSLPVRIEQRKKGTSTWALLATKPSSSSGVVSASVKPTASTEYRWRFLGKDGWIASTSATKAVLVRPAITRAVNDSTIRLGGSFTVSGRVLPRMDGQSIKLQRYYSGSWHTVKSATLARYDTTRSKYAMTYKPTGRGTLKFRVYKPADAYHVSNNVTFSVTVR